MKFGSVCSGIEAASLAFGPLGWSASWFAEIEKFPSAVLAHHYPDVPNLGDMTKLPAKVLSGEIEAPEMLVGGTPCQAFSVAGLREGLSDPRGQLTIKFVELADAIDHVRAGRGTPPCVVFWENVPGVFSDKGNAFGCFLGALSGEDCELKPAGGKWSDAGCVFGPSRAIAWRVLDAQYFGLAQRRRRVFLVASARNGFHPAQVLFEFDGVRRDTPPSREPREEVARTVSARTSGGGGLGTDFDCAGGLQAVAGSIQASGKAAGSCTQQDAESGLLIPATYCVATGQAGADMSPTLSCNHEAPYIAHTLRGEGLDASEDGTGRGTPLVVVHGTQDPCTSETTAFALGRNNGGENAICFDTTQITSTANRSNPRPGDACHAISAGAHAPAIAFSCKDHGADASPDVAPTMRAMGHSTSHANAGGQLAVAFSTKLHNTQSNQSGKIYEEYTAGLDRSSPPPALLTATQVRRLMPIECERLQGAPDNYTKIPSWNGWRAMGDDETPEQCVAEGLEVKQNPKTLHWRVKDVDGPRYRALGNTWAINCVRWIGVRINAQLEALRAAA